jgi:hypothetical protein
VRKPIQLDAAARAEYLEAVRWYADRSPETADRFRCAVDAALVRLGDGGTTGNAYLFGSQCARLRRFPFLIVYRETPHAIQVIALAHVRRRPGYWRRRLAD